MNIIRTCAVVAAMGVLAGCQTMPTKRGAVPKDKLTVVAFIVAEEGKTELVKAEMMKLLEATRAEEGCMNYDLHQDNKNPAQFIFFENWTSEETLSKHADSPHINAYKKATQGAVADFSVLKMTEIDADRTMVGSGGKTDGLALVAKITAKDDQIELVKAGLRKLIPATRAEEGCINYDLHQDNENPAVFLFYENWATTESWQAHMEAQHIKDFLAATEEAIEDLAIHELSHVN